MKAKEAEKMPAVKIGAQTIEKGKCQECGKEELSENLYSFAGKGKKDVVVCKNCLDKINDMYKAETKNINLPLGLITGIVAAVVAGIAWYLVAVTTKTEFGYLALGIGYLIGYAVFWGAGKKRGIQLQLAAVVLTIISLVVAEAFILAHFVSIEISKSWGVKPSMVTVLEKGILAEGEFKSIFLSAYKSALTSPIGLLIKGYALYLAYNVAKPRKIKA
jgi:hypothetical protein